MAKAKGERTLVKAAICKKTHQGNGRGSRPKQGRKLRRGQGR